MTDDQTLETGADAADQAAAPKPAKTRGRKAKADAADLAAHPSTDEAPAADPEPADATAPEGSAPEAPPEPPVAEPPTRTPTGKIAALVALLKQPDGVSVETMMEATGWQAHSVRGALSGAIKKKLGLEVLSQKTETGRVYRLAHASEPKA